MSRYNGVVLREEVPEISRKLLQIHVNKGYIAVDEYASSEEILREVSQLVGGRPVEWEPQRMLWRVIDNELA